MLGFTKTSSLVFFSLTAVVFGIFCIIRLPILNYGTWSTQAGPGEWFVFGQGWPMFWEKVHLRSVMPAGALMPLQFSPLVRRKWTSFHRWNGRLITSLLLLGSVAGIYVSRYAFGGTIASQTASITLAILIIISTLRGIRAIRVKQVDAHRRWMIRCWGWTGSILTMRIVNIFLLVTYSKLSPTGYHTVASCDRIISTYTHRGLSEDLPLLYYPQCANTSTGSGSGLVIVNAVLHLNRKARPEQSAAMIELCFGPAFWVGILLNVLFVEWYLSSTRVAKPASIDRRTDGSNGGEQLHVKKLL